jgi:hypothetical protein
MVYYYAQILDGRVMGVLQTHAEIIADHMIRIDSFDTSKVGWMYSNGQFTPSVSPLTT